MREATVSLALSFSETAREELTSRGERVIVDLMPYGEPAPGVDTDESPVIDLSFAEIVREVEPLDGTVMFTFPVNADAIATQIIGEPRLLVNVYSARLAGPDNILDCGLLDDTLTAAEAAATPIACKLIGE